MKSNAERQKAYRERKKAEKAALKDMQATMPPTAEADLQASIDPAPESAMQSPSVMELMEGQERYRKKLQPEPVLDKPEEITVFDVQKRRMERDGRR